MQEQASLADKNRVWARYQIWLLVALFSLGILIMGQPFPIYDDWSYGWSVKHLLETGELRYLATFATAVPVIFSGALAAKIFGFSFQLMHYQTAFYNVVAALGLYYSVRVWTKNTLIACISAGTLLFNPILVNISFAFMTDTAALACFTWGFWALSKILRQQRSAFAVALLLILASIGILTRQSFIGCCPLLVVAAASTFAVSRKTSIIIFSAIPLQFLLLSASQDYLQTHMHYTADFHRLKFAFEHVLQAWLQKPLSFIYDAWTTAAKIMCYVGPFSLPIIIWRLPQVIRVTWSFENDASAAFRKKASLGSLLAALLLVAVPLTYLFSFCEIWMPYFHAFWDFPRVGSYTWITNEPLRTEAMTQYWTFACVLFGTLSFWIGAYCVTDLAHLAKISKNRMALQFLTATMLCTAVMLVFAFIQGNSLNYDRYVIPFLVPLLLISSITPSSSGKCKIKHTAYSEEPEDKLPSGPSTKAAFISVIVLALYSFTAAIDFVNFQNARWKAAIHMEQNGARVDEIDVGPDYIFYKVPAIYQYCNPPSHLRSFQQNSMTGPPPLGELRQWPILNEKYVLNPEFDPSLFVGFKPIYSQPYWSPWHWNKMQQILVMEKDPFNTRKYVRPAWVYDVIRPITHPGN